MGEHAERTVGSRDNVIEELRGTHGATAALDVVHGGIVGLAGLLHGGDDTEEVKGKVRLRWSEWRVVDRAREKKTATPKLM